MLRFLEDLSEDEFAALLGVKVGTVEVALHAGIEQLRRLLDESGRDG